jgi:RNA polymerase sigma-70 factor (ECF subfamily)
MPGEATRHAPSPAAGTDEAALVRAAQAGDRPAFAELVERYWGRLFRWLYQMTHDRHLAEDLAQDAFLKAFHHLRRFRAGTNFRAWLFRIAHNAFANHQRGASRSRGALPDELPSKAPGPVEDTLSKEALAALAAAIKQLPTDLRAALLLRAEEELSFREIAGILSTTEETARWRVFKARQRLMGELEARLEREKS